MKLGRQTVFGEFQAKNFACSGNDLQELFRKSNVKLGGGTGTTGWRPTGNIGLLDFHVGLPEAWGSGGTVSHQINITKQPFSLNI